MVILINLLFVILVFLLFEIFLRLIKYNYHPLSIKYGQVLGENDFRSFHAFDDKDTMYDKDLYWVPNKSTPIVNKQGFIGNLAKSASSDEENKDSKSAYTIFAIGDSNTAGFHNGISWVGFLSDIFRQNKYDVDVINAGVWGYSSYQGLIRLEKVIRQYKPNLVLISFGSNDALPVLISDKDWTINQKVKKSINNNFFDNLKLVVLGHQIVDEMRTIFHKESRFKPRVSLSDYKDNLTKMLDVAKANNVQIVFLTRPFIYYDGEQQNPDPYSWKSYGPEYNEETRLVANIYNIPIIDVYSKFEGDKDLFIDESHFTEEGHKIMADYIYNVIKEIIKEK